MVKRCELSEARWRPIEGQLPGKKGDPGGHGADNRLFVNGVLRVLRSNWRALARPARALRQLDELA